MTKKKDKSGTPAQWLNAVRAIERTFGVVIFCPDHLIGFCQSLELQRARLEEKTRAAARVLDMAPADFDDKVRGRHESPVQDLGSV